MKDNSIILYFRRFFSGVFLSRISGMVRDLTMAFIFGDHPSVAAFFVAFRFSNLLRRLTGEGPFQAAFTPHFEEMRLKDPAKSYFFFRRLIFIFIVVLLLITVIVEGGLSFFLDYAALSEANKEIFILLRWLFPSLLFICLYGLNLALLHCHNSFFLPSIAPFICNVIWIIAVLHTRNKDPAIAMINLSRWVFLGFIAQWLITLPQTFKYVLSSFKEWFSFKFPLEIKTLFKAFSLGAFGVGASQINAFIDVSFARYVDLKGPVYLWYSIRLNQFALAIFGIVCVGSIVPSLARAIKSSDLLKAQTFFSVTYKRILILMFFCTIAILALGSNSVNLLFGRGSFSEIAISKTTLCLWAYGFSLLPTTMVMLYSAIFYAFNNFKTPTFVSLISVSINIIVNTLFVFVFKFGIVSIALATSLSSWINFMILQKLVKPLGFKEDYSLLKTVKLGAIGVCSLILCGVIDRFFIPSAFSWFLAKEGAVFSRLFSVQLFEFLVQFLLLSTSLIGFSLIFKNTDLLSLIFEFLGKKNTKEEVF